MTAFREQHDLEMSREKIWFLENHEMCLHTLEVPQGIWNTCNGSLGRFLNLYTRERLRFKDTCAVWLRRAGKYVIPDNLVFVSFLEPLQKRRIAVFRYRRDLTAALEEFDVAQILES